MLNRRSFIKRAGLVGLGTLLWLHILGAGTIIDELS